MKEAILPIWLPNSTPKKKSAGLRYSAGFGSTSRIYRIQPKKFTAPVKTSYSELGIPLLCTMNVTDLTVSDDGSDDESVVIVVPNVVQSIGEAIVQPNAFFLPMAIATTFILGTLWGNPIPQQQRAMGRGRRYFNPNAQQKVQTVAQLRANRIDDNDHGGPLPGPIHMTISFFFRATQQHQFGQPYTRTPDTDNLIKFLLDAMETAGFFENDSLVYSIRASKMYCPSENFNEPHTSYHLYQRNI
jgi:Holliday junction resolvase RusA-like endonuclease